MEFQYRNISERYGGPEVVTIEDYRQLNPAGTFEDNGFEIIEYDDEGDVVEVVAEAESVLS